MFSKIKVKAPATTANVGASFDCLGIAVQLFNSITIEILSNESQKDIYIYNQKQLDLNDGTKQPNEKHLCCFCHFLDCLFFFSKT